MDTKKSNTSFKKKPVNKVAGDSNNKVKIISLGGLGEVGKNCYVIEYEKDIFIIDFGVLFPDKYKLGVDYILPNYKYLIKNKHKIRGLFITHGHEDHIGGIPFLLRKLRIQKIYAPLTAKLMIEKKLKEAKLTAKIVQIDYNTTLTFEKTKIHAFRQTHSTPDSLGFFFENPVGNIVTTGDFKVDFSPPGQDSADFHKMVLLAQKGVMAMLSDSTNAQTPGFSISESMIGLNLKTLIREAKGRIFFTTFASNINRVQQIIQGAIENDRKVCVMGRSLTNAIDIGMKTGYIQITKDRIIEPKEVKNYPDNKVCVITTGSQGEELAALSRIANNLNLHIDIKEEDTVVFASNPIPGNNYQIGKVIDVLYKRGCQIIKNNDIFKTHASGHASQEEQKLLLTLFKPRFFVPIHGTHTMQLAHRATAVKLGISAKNNLVLNNGDILEFTNSHPKIYRGAVDGESIFVSGNNIDIPQKNKSMQKLASDGILIFVAFCDDKKNLLTYPQLTTRGFIVINESLPLLKKFQNRFSKIYNENKHHELEELQTILNQKMFDYIESLTNKRPLVTTNILTYNKDHKPQ